MDARIKITLPFVITQNNVKHSSVNLTKHLQDLYAEKYKVLIKEIRGDLNKWRDTPCSRVRRGGRLIVNMSIVSQTGRQV